VSFLRGPDERNAKPPSPSGGSPVHQLLGGLLVVLEELAVVLTLHDLRVERQRLPLNFFELMVFSR
jgi:hypothetical protein